jgi:hypothetical protein
MRKRPKKTFLVLSLVVLGIGVLVLADIFVFQSGLTYKDRGGGADYAKRRTAAAMEQLSGELYSFIGPHGDVILELQEKVLDSEITPKEAWEVIAEAWREYYGKDNFRRSFTDAWSRWYIIEFVLGQDEHYGPVWELTLRSKGQSGLDQGGAGDDIVYGPIRFWLLSRWESFMEWPRGVQGTARGETIDRIDY